MADPKELAERLTKLVTGTSEWRVADPKTGSYCMAFNTSNANWPAVAAREWLADHRRRFPESPFAKYEAREVVEYSELEQAALEAVDILNGLAAANAEAAGAREAHGG